MRTNTITLLAAGAALLLSPAAYGATTTAAVQDGRLKVDARNAVDALNVVVSGGAGACVSPPYFGVPCPGVRTADDQIQVFHRGMTDTVQPGSGCDADWEDARGAWCDIVPVDLVMGPAGTEVYWNPESAGSTLDAGAGDDTVLFMTPLLPYANTVADLGPGRDEVQGEPGKDSRILAADGEADTIECSAGTTVVHDQHDAVTGDCAREPREVAPPDRTPPALVSIDPAYGAENVKRAANITLTFSEPVDRAATERSFDVYGVSGTITWSGQTMTFDPGAGLDANREYQVYFTPRDTAGNEGDSGFSYFRTGRK